MLTGNIYFEDRTSDFKYTNLLNDKTFGLAFAKSQFATGNKIPKSGVAFLSVKKDDRKHILKIAQELKKSGFDIIGTSGTSDFLNSSGVECKKINKVIEGKPHIEDSLNAKKIALVINTSQGKQSIKDSFSLRRAALTSGTPYYTTIAGANAITEAIKSLKNYKFLLSYLDCLYPPNIHETLLSIFYQ